MNLLIIQARMGSTRLPGKVLQKIQDKTILEHLVERISPAQKVDQWIVATTTNKEDDVLAAFCQERGWNVYRGSDWDVLDRFYQACQLFSGVDQVVRVTSDCPLHHHEVIDFALTEYMERGVTYFSNSNHEPDYLEDGFDVEVFSYEALAEAWKKANLMSEREHVTPYIKKASYFTHAWKKYDAGYNYKLSVDTADDFKAAELIFQHFSGQPLFTMQDVIELLLKRPEIIEYNRHSVINSGYQKSLKEDRKICK